MQGIILLPCQFQRQLLQLVKSTMWAPS